MATIPGDGRESVVEVPDAIDPAVFDRDPYPAVLPGGEQLELPYGRPGEQPETD
jgi:hypothetical protein